MAVTDRNIVITPNRTATGKVQPKIVFTGADSSTGDSAAITLFANPENSGTLSFSGTAGQLFSITNDLSGTIFSVNDISGIPSLSVNDQGIIQLAEFNGRVIIGDSVGSDDSASTLQVSGALTADSATLTGGITASHFNTPSSTSSDKFRYFGQSTNYVSGFKGGYTYGGLSGDGGDGFAINWTMNNSAGRGFIWNKSSHSDAQGAMALTNTGKLTVAHSIRVGHGEGDTTTPGATHRLDVSGSLTADSASLSKTTITNSGTIGTLSSNVAANAYLKITDGTNTIGFDGNEITQSNSGSPGALHFAANQFFFRPGNSGSDTVAQFNATGTTRLYHNKIQKFMTTDSGITVTGSLITDSATINGDVTFDSAGAVLFDKSDQSLKFGDNYKAKFGNSGGLQLTHTGSFGFITTNFVQVKNAAGVLAAQLFPGNSSILHFNNTPRIETTDSGANIIGNIRINNNPFPASAIATGTIDSARFPAALPAVSGANLTNLPDAGDGGIAMAIALG